MYNDDNWHYATITYENGLNNLYGDGQLIATGQGFTYGFNTSFAYFVGTEDVETDTSTDAQPWKYLPGQIDEISVSNIARSADWIQTQFNNQSPPSRFYSSTHRTPFRWLRPRLIFTLRKTNSSSFPPHATPPLPSYCRAVRPVF